MHPITDDEVATGPVTSDVAYPAAGKRDDLHIPTIQAIDEQPGGNSRIAGRLKLSFEHHPLLERTVLAVHEQHPPLQVVRGFAIADGASSVHLHNLSGGVLGGDSLHLVVDVEPDGRAQITTTGATRLYRCRAGAAPAVQRTVISVGKDGLLEFLPDPLIPFAGARYHEETRIDLAAGAGLFWWEIVAPGRDARGEIFAYDLLHLNRTVTALGKPVLLERARLEPRLRPLQSPLRLGCYRYFASLVICRVGVDPARWLELEAKLSERAEHLCRPGEVLWGISTLPAHGIVVRAVSRAGHTIPPGLLDLWRAAKLELYGCDAVPPRKLY